MKKSKKFLALVLAMMMAFSMMAMPASACGDGDGIDPQIGTGPEDHNQRCGICGNFLVLVNGEYVCLRHS